MKAALTRLAPKTHIELTVDIKQGITTAMPYKKAAT
jgi:hypothetical protein